MATLRNRKRLRTEVLERPEYGWIWKPLLVLLVLYLVVCIGLGIWWSQRPGDFSVEQAVAEQRGEASSQPAARGTVIVASLMNEVETLLDKPGGYLRNDIAPPGVWLDNMPSWEFGVLQQARLMTRALPALSAENVEGFDEASEALASDSQDWLYPAAEERYGEAIEVLGEYLGSLSGQGASGFVDSGSGLAEWLRTVSQRFDALTHRLSASVDDPDALRELGVDEAELPDTTPWFRIDNTFFEARGDAWALMHLLQAAKKDYADVLSEAGARGDIERMIAELELAQRQVWSPIILNGSGFGIFANHSLVLANHTTAVSDQASDLAGSVADVTVESAAAARDADAMGDTADDAAPAGDGGQNGEDALINGGEASSEEEAISEEAQANERGSVENDAAEGAGNTQRRSSDSSTTDDRNAGSGETLSEPSALGADSNSSTDGPAGESLSSPPNVPAATSGT